MNNIADVTIAAVSDGSPAFAHFLTAFALGFGAALGATVFHFEILRWVARYIDRRFRRPRYAVVLTIASILGAHLAEIALHIVSFWLGSGPFAIGDFRGMSNGRALELFYSAAETYSSLGYVDIVPTGSLRLLASILSLNGIILLAWSGSFLFNLAQRLHRN
jgi:hypothetical protein